MRDGDSKQDIFPYEIEDDIGEISAVEPLCPGVYYVAAMEEDESNVARIPQEYYIVERSSSSISAVAKAHGKAMRSNPALLCYELDDLNGGRWMVQYEYLRYRQLHQLPLDDSATLLGTATFGREYLPDYFGDYPAPEYTPRGRTLRYKTFMRGVFFLETDRGEKMMSVCYPIWSCDFSDFVIGLGEQMESDRESGIDHSLGNLYFSEESACLALFELRQRYQAIIDSSMIDPAAMMNTIWEQFPLYAAAHNLREQQGLNDAAGLFLRSLGMDIDLIRNEEDLIRLTLNQGTAYILF